MSRDKSLRERILVVDDNPINLKLVCDFLESEGFQVQRAADADHAQEELSKSLPQLILMDIGLPGMDGLTLTRKLKDDPATKQIRIVALTAFAMKSDHQKALDAGCDGYISKPIEIRKLIAQIEEILKT
jgi:CheY-like chemotaxis protein